MTRTLAAVLPAFLLCSALGGCGYAWQTPKNAQSFDAPSAFMAERRAMPDDATETTGDAVRWNAARCALQPSNGVHAAAFESQEELDPPLSPGDLVRVTVTNNEAPTGSYKVESNGRLQLDMVGDLRVDGLTANAAQAELSHRLVSGGFFRTGFDHASLKLLDRAAAHIQVTGAVFQPGQIVINDTSAVDKDHEREIAMGGHADGRSLSIAVQRAGGIRPDADIAHVTVERAGRRREIDLTGLIDGGSVGDIFLVSGDHVTVPSRHCFQPELARPSPITPPGVRIYISNLSSPASNNAGAAIGKESTSFPYGTRFLAALVSGNCVGGTQLTNADRWAVLITTNPLTGGTEVVERRIEDLVRRSDRDAFNPVLLPGDSIACYDSVMSNVGAILAMIGQTITPAALMQNAMR